MDSLLLKLILTPILIAGVSVAGRRWGPSVSGWLVGLPLTTGPIALYLAMDHGTDFGAATAIGVLTGTISTAVFCVTYSRVAYHLPWFGTETISILAFFAFTWLFRSLTIPLVPLIIVLAVLLPLAVRLVPFPEDDAGDMELPWWDLPARVILATLFVLLLTGLAPQLGPHLSGLLAPFPLFASILGVFNQHFHGPHAAARVCHGILLGLLGYCSFFLVLAATLQRVGIPIAFVAALLLTLTVHRLSMGLLR